MIYFSREEFECNCGCGQDTVDYKLVDILDNVREHFGVPVTVTSGVRCAQYNLSVGGVPSSQHVRGRAADIQVAGRSPKEVADYAETLKVPGLGRYSTFTHIDTRSTGPAKWGHN